MPLVTQHVPGGVPPTWIRLENAKARITNKHFVAGLFVIQLRCMRHETPVQVWPPHGPTSVGR